MKALVRHVYGSPEVLHVEEVPMPSIGDGDVLVKVHAVPANAGDRHLLRGRPLPFRPVEGFRTPKHRIIGNDIAGRVEAVGRLSRSFDPVMRYSENGHGAPSGRAHPSSGCNRRSRGNGAAGRLGTRLAGDRDTNRRTRVQWGAMRHGIAGIHGNRGTVESATYRI